MANGTSDAEIEQLKREWGQRFDEFLRDTTLTPEDLRRIAAEARSLAEGADLAGQRRGFLRAAERLERAAIARAATTR